MTKKTIKRIKRSTQVDGNLVTVKKPAFLSLVKKPSNQRAFSVLRSEEEETPVSSSRIRRTRRSEGSNLVSIQFAASMEEKDVQDTLTSYGLSAYTVTRAEGEGEWLAQSDVAIDCKPEDLEKVVLQEGITAFVKRTEDTTPTEAKDKLDVIAYRFDTEVFDPSKVTDWLTRNSVDFTDKSLNNSTGAIVLQRKEMEEGEETREIELEEGVTAVLVRSCECGVPEGFVAVVNEYAYSGWGWGQLDFDAYLADVTVGDKLREGIYMLENVFRNILFNSPVPVDLKKELVTRAALQFAAYAGSMLDSLPRQLLMSVANTQRSEKENVMSKADPSAAGATNQGQPLTRADVAEVVAEVLRSEEQKKKDAEAAELKRSEEATATEEANKAAAELRRSELSEALKPLLDRMDKMEGVTTVRSDAGDPTVTTDKPKGTVKRSDEEVFRGALGGIRKVATTTGESE